MRDELIGNLLRRLLDAAERDASLRAAVRAAAEGILADLDAIDRRPPPAPAAPAPAAPTPVTPGPAAGGAGATTPLAVSPAPASAPAPAPPAAKPPAPPAPRVQTPLRIGDEVRLVEVRGAPDVAPAPGHRGPIPVAAPQAAPPAAAGPATPAGAAAAGGVLDPPLASRRCAVKAEAARWAIERRRRIAAGDREFHDRDRELFARAKALPNCYLWMMDPKGPPLPADPVLDAAAGCYDTLAAAVLLVAPPAGANGGSPGAAPASPAGVPEESFEEALYLLAEAQSALRAVLAEVLPTLQDWDQREVFFWLRRQTAERGIYVSRYMRMDDAASPDDWRDLRRRVDDLRARGQARQQQRKARQSLLGKARYHAKHISAPDGPSSPADWQKLTAALEDLVKAGVPPSDVEIRDLVVPLLDDLPDEDALGLGPGMRAILAETERYLVASREGDEARGPERGPGPEVRRVAELLRGKTVVLIGGEARPHARRALEQSFELAELDWIATQAHQSVTAFEPAVARPETALVLLAIRWSSHSFGEVKSMCDRYGKPFVRLPGGYNPDQVARQILEQVSGRL